MPLKPSAKIHPGTIFQWISLLVENLNIDGSKGTVPVIFFISALYRRGASRLTVSHEFPSRRMIYLNMCAVARLKLSVPSADLNVPSPLNRMLRIYCCWYSGRCIGISSYFQFSIRLAKLLYRLTSFNPKPMTAFMYSFFSRLLPQTRSDWGI
jgi:hypothetical protein